MKIVYAALFICIVWVTPTQAKEAVEQIWHNRFLYETTSLIKIQSFRDASLQDKQVAGNLDKIKQLIFRWAGEYNGQLRNLMLQPFEWKKEIKGKQYRLFGLRLGTGANKVAMITHVDTVPPGTLGWKPFDPRIERRMYMGENMDFLVGRGAIDDKGPSISAFIALRALAKTLDSSDKLDQYTVELIFDTSEETDMATPHYFSDKKSVKPEFGIVFDAMWCVRAEKGIERPQFYIKAAAENKSERKLWVDAINSAPGPVNQIPSNAMAVVKGDSLARLERFAEKVEKEYPLYRFDDAQYKPARLDVIRQDGNLLLKTYVTGAQHGSAPEQNRLEGANPLVSLVNYIAHLVEQRELADNRVGTMARFIKWAWGTRVFGESHRDILQAHDEVFVQGNGTSYAITKLLTEAEQIILALDVRYAIGHNSEPWDGRSEGLLAGQSRFESVFEELTRRFNRRANTFKVSYSTKTIFTPDIRLPNNVHFSRLNRAYKAVMGQDCRFIGIGGGTDAKGHPELLAVGPLFSSKMGPPINFHGENEGAPVKHLKQSTLILYNVMLDAVTGAR